MHFEFASIVCASLAKTVVFHLKFGICQHYICSIESVTINEYYFSALCRICRFHRYLHIDFIFRPCILIFDSLTGANRARIVATLRDYLTVEHKVRKGAEKLFTRDTMKGACPRVPQQMNYSDCGVYTLQFAESFFEVRHYWYYFALVYSLSLL